jgi:CheY-like chemotaxis protein
MTDQSVTILVVDDDHGHCELVRRNLRRAGIANEISFLHSGEEALNFVSSSGQYVSRQSDNGLLMLLDINMPGGLSGLDVLQHIKAAPETRKIPVIMLTTTDDPRDIDRCYDLGCSVYITKPVDPERFIDAVARLGALISMMQMPDMSRHIIRSS